MPSQVEPQTQEGQRASSEATAATGSEDEAISAFNRRAQSQAQDESDAPTDEPQDDPDLEAEEAEPDPEVDAAEQLVEVEFEGEMHKLSPKLKNALLRQADYSRHMGELSASKKDYAQRIESAKVLIEGAEQFAVVKAEALQIEAQIKQYENVDWNTLERDDPARASLLAVKFLQLQQTRDNLASKAKAIDSELASGRSKLSDAARVEMVKALSKEFPGGWNDVAGKRLGDYVLSQGFTSEDLGQVSDAKTVLLWEKARKFDAIQSGKAKALDQTREAPQVAKPGAPRRATPVADIEKRFQRSTSPEDAEALFEARAGARRR